MRREFSHPNLRSKMLKVAPQDNTTIDLLVFVERAFYDIHDHYRDARTKGLFLRNLNIESRIIILQGQSKGHQHDDLQQQQPWYLIHRPLASCACYFGWNFIHHIMQHIVG